MQKNTIISMILDFPQKTLRIKKKTINRYLCFFQLSPVLCQPLSLLVSFLLALLQPGPRLLELLLLALQALLLLELDQSHLLDVLLQQRKQRPILESSSDILLKKIYIPEPR